MTIEEMNNELRGSGIDKYDMEVAVKDGKPAAIINGEPFDADTGREFSKTDCQIASYAFIAGWFLAADRLSGLVLELAEGAEPDYLENVLESCGAPDELLKRVGLG